MNSLDALLDLYWRYLGVGEGYWKLFTASNTAIFGWLILKKTFYSRSTRAWAVAGYLLFAGAVYLGLHDNSAHVEAARSDLSAYARDNEKEFVPDSKYRVLLTKSRGFSWKGGLQFVYLGSVGIMTALIALDVFSRNRPPSGTV